MHPGREEEFNETLQIESVCRKHNTGHCTKFISCNYRNPRGDYCQTLTVCIVSKGMDVEAVVAGLKSFDFSRHCHGR